MSIILDVVDFCMYGFREFDLFVKLYYILVRKCFDIGAIGGKEEDL